MSGLADLDTDRADETTLPALSRLEQLELQNLSLRRQLCRAQMDLLTMQFLHTPQPKMLQEQIEELTKEMNARAERIFSACNLDARQYQLNVDEGRFVRRSADS